MVNTHEPAGAGAPVGPSALGGHHADGSNPEVRFEPTDVGTRGVVIFVVALAVVIVVSAGLLTGLFRLYEQRAVKANAANTLPLVERERLPVRPRLEGINPNEDVDRAWPRANQPESPPPWFGYNVRVVPPDGSANPSVDAGERDRLATAAMAQSLKKVDAAMQELAGKLPARNVDLPPDRLRRSAGEGDAGRSAGERQP
jgi:hypothetical protein